ncbi:MAG: DNA polymerase III subunit alpha [Candidatus Melainabacteria bacterium]|nr:DNA polymerase III subunit alpha [Candidatus Melainabacteria bacterium]
MSDAFENPSVESNKPRPYVPLHVHSHYSLLTAASRPSDLIRIAQDNNMPAMALTDSGTMYGAIELYTQGKAAGIKPIIGCEVFVVDGEYLKEDRTRKPNFHLVLLAKSFKGYQNLVDIVSEGQLRGFYYRPRINWDYIAERAEGLIALTSCLNGPLGHAILRGNPQEARERAAWLKNVFGADAFLELSDHGSDTERQVNLELVKIGRELGMDCVITNDSHFSKPEHMAMHDAMLCLQSGKTLNEPGRMRQYGPDYFLKNGDQLAANFPYLEQSLVERALDNTLMIADRCNLELPMGQSILPDYPLPEGASPADALRDTVEEHARWRYGENGITPDIQERLDFELNIINQMGFPTYFLIVWDFINYARQQHIPVGPGRGSAAGSLVAYCLGITNIDPLEHNLLFERFLNPERVSMPDIDIDFCIERRGEVIDYVSQKYGQERVCQIATFGTLAARAAVKAIARVMEIPYADSDRWAKMIPGMPGTKLKDALAEGMELQKEYANNPQAKEVIDLALQIEGTVFNVGTHAAGVVIAKDPLRTLIPLQLSKEGQVISQYPMGDLEKLGMLKMDFLGLRNLTIIHNTLKLVEQTQPATEVDMDHPPLDDNGVYKLLTSGDTDGVFQLESSGMKALVKDLKPSVFEDINALVALYRPGPLNSGMVKTFVDRKHGRAQVEYLHPDLEPILKDTYGTIVYQEQIMQIAQVLAGYSLGQADLLRRAMGKKKADVMAKEREGFVNGAIAHGVDETLANNLFDTMSEFAAYCFNRSHSAAYAFVAFQTAYLKAHHPVEYLSALLSSVQSSIEKIQHYIGTAKALGIATLPPDVTRSGLDFTPDGRAIRFGLASVKNVGVGVVEDILNAREQKPFESLEDLLQRVDPKVLNRKTLESLVLCGALDSFGYRRKHLFDNIDTLVRFAEQRREQAETGQVSLFSSLGSEAETYSGLMLAGRADEEYSPEEIQAHEKALLGFYVSSHPLDSVREQLPMMVSHAIGELAEVADGTEVRVGGLIADAKRRTTRSNKPMFIGALEDWTGRVEFVAFGETIERYNALLQDGQRIILSGKLQVRGDDNETFSIMTNSVESLEGCTPFTLSFLQPPRYEDIVLLARILVEHRGQTPVILSFPDGTRIKTAAKFWIDGSKQPQVQASVAHQFEGKCAV